MIRHTSLAVLLIGTTGCSFIHAIPPSHVGTCDIANPVLDTIGAIGAVAGVGALSYMASRTTVQRTGDPTTDQQNLDQVNGRNGSLIAGAAAGTIAYIASAIYGANEHTKCVEQKKAEQEADNYAQEQARLAAIAQQHVLAQQQADEAVAREAWEKSQRVAAEAFLKKTREQAELCSESVDRRQRHHEEHVRHDDNKAWCDANVSTIRVCVKPTPSDVVDLLGPCQGYQDVQRWPTKGRPTHLDGSKLTDADIISGNYATKNDSASEVDWYADEGLTSKCMNGGSQ